MKEITINGKRILLVEVSETDIEYALYFFIGTDNQLYYNWGQLDVLLRSLPPGSWQLLFADPLHPTEEEAAGVIPNQYGVGKCYENFGAGHPCFDTALESWNSLVTSHGFTPGRVVPLVDRPATKNGMPYRKCYDCGTEYYSNGRCPECSPMG